MSKARLKRRDEEEQGLRRCGACGGSLGSMPRECDFVQPCSCATPSGAKARARFAGHSNQRRDEIEELFFS